MTALSEIRRVAAEQEWPRLRVWKGWRLWLWAVIRPDGTWADGWGARTHAEALAVGLAALQVASVAGSAS